MQHRQFLEYRDKQNVSSIMHDVSFRTAVVSRWKNHVLESYSLDRRPAATHHTRLFNRWPTHTNWK